MTMNNTREKILDTATRLFYLKGYHATGLNLIIKESGAPKGSLYYHFPNGKEQLAIEAIEVSKKAVGQSIMHFLNTHENAVDAIQAHIQTMADLFTSEEGINSDSLAVMPFGLIAAESAFENENMRNACNETFRYWEGLYAQKIIAQGYSVESATTIATTINAMIEGAVTLSLSQKSNEPLLRIKLMVPRLFKQ